MPSNPLLHFVKTVLNLKEVKVINYHFITDDELLIDVQSTRKEVRCSHCGSLTNRIHQNHWYRVRDIPMSDYSVFLNVNRRQFRCSRCKKVFSEELEFVKKRRTYTQRLAQNVIEEVLESNVVSAARRNRMTPPEIETILKELESERLTEKPKGLKKLGIDEIAHLKGGKNYAAVLVDLETRKPIAILEKRNKETIAEYLLSLGKEILEQIEEVSIDLWVPYKSVVQELLPNAQVVADRFHVVKQINDELDARRKAENRVLKAIKNKKKRESGLEILKGSKYPLLKHPDKLKPEEKEKLEEVSHFIPELGEMYKEKEKLREIFESQITSDKAFYKLMEWTEESFTYFPKSCRTISKWIDEIVAYFDHRTTNGIVEGINQKIKLIKRKAYGLKNFDAFRRRVLLNWYFS